MHLSKRWVARKLFREPIRLFHEYQSSELWDLRMKMQSCHSALSFFHEFLSCLRRTGTWWCVWTSSLSGSWYREFTLSLRQRWCSETDLKRATFVLYSKTVDKNSDTCFSSRIYKQMCPLICIIWHVLGGLWKGRIHREMHLLGTCSLYKIVKLYKMKYTLFERLQTPKEQNWSVSLTHRKGP